MTVACNVGDELLVLLLLAAPHLHRRHSSRRPVAFTWSF